MKRIGPHVSTQGGVQNAPTNAKAIGATAFGMFTKNQRRWVSKPYDKTTIDQFRKNMEDNGYEGKHVLAHAGYLINIGHPDKDTRVTSYNSLVDELTRCAQLGVTLLNLHPGSYLNVCTEDECLGIIAESINRALDETKDVTVVLENTAGQGSNVGYKFEHLAAIIDKVEDKTRVGFCIDTCHAFAAGYDLRTENAYSATMKKVEDIIGIKYLKGMHLNDSKTDLGSHRDRHHSIGEGFLGSEVFRFIMNDPRMEEIPMILETIDETKWPEEIRMLYGMEKGKLE